MVVVEMWRCRDVRMMSFDTIEPQLVNEKQMVHVRMCEGGVEIHFAHTQHTL